MSWLTDNKTELAETRILDAAAKLFMTSGVEKFRLDDVAKEAGCSRATVYRYFDSKQTLLFAFARREALAILSVVTVEIEKITDPIERATTAVIKTLEALRARPDLYASYTNGEVSFLVEIVKASSLINQIGADFIGTAAKDADRQLASWIIRIILSLLTIPGQDLAEERELITRFLAPYMTEI